MYDARADQLQIAIAEDDADLRNAFVGMLQLLGHTVVCAAGDGAELLAACSQLKVDLVVVDLDMPVIDGLQAAETLAEQGIPVVLISGHPDVQDVVLEHEPVVARIVKPATLERFRKAIAEAMTAKD
jgi:two-component system, response regulator PdtaR